jgi:hypothetical protein
MLAKPHHRDKRPKTAFFFAKNDHDANTAREHYGRETYKKRLLWYGQPRL